MAGDDWRLRQFVLTERMYKQALTRQEKVLGSSHPDVAQSLINLARLYGSEIRCPEAQSLVERSLKILEEHWGKEHASVADALSWLAHLHETQGDRCWMNPAAGKEEKVRHYTAAEAYQKRALSIREKVLGPNHPLVAQSLYTLAHLYAKLKRGKEAESLYQRAVAIWATAGESERKNLATGLSNLAELYSSHHRYREAELLYKRTLAIVEGIVSPDHPNVGVVLEKLAQAYKGLGKEAEVQQAGTRANAIRARALASAQSLDRRAKTFQAQGKPEEAEPLYRQALDLREQFLGSEHLDLAQSLGNLASVYEEQGDFHAPQPLLNWALAILRKHFGPDNPSTVEVSKRIARIRAASDSLPRNPRMEATRPSRGVASRMPMKKGARQ